MQDCRRWSLQNIGDIRNFRATGTLMPMVLEVIVESTIKGVTIDARSERCTNKEMAVPVHWQNENTNQRNVNSLSRNVILYFNGNSALQAKHDPTTFLFREGAFVFVVPVVLYCTLRQSFSRQMPHLHRLDSLTFEIRHFIVINKLVIMPQPIERR